jgi:hypothetical protein
MGEGRDGGGGGEGASTLTVTTLGKMTPRKVTLSTGNTKGITVLLTSGLTVLE